MEIFDYLDLLEKYFIPIIIGLATFLVLFTLMSKTGLKKPGGLGFKNISLKVISSNDVFEGFKFSNLVRGLLVIGGAGSGKTKSIIEPLIKQAIKNSYSGVVYDFKFPVLANVIYEETLLLSESKIKYYYVNFVDLSKSNRYNVLKLVDNSAHAKEYATAFLMNLLPESIKQQDFFLRTATSLLTATIFYFSRYQRKRCTLPHVISFLLLPDISKIVSILSEDPEVADLAAPVRSGLSSDKQTAGVIATLQTALSTCANPSIFWVLSGDDFDLNLNSQSDPKLLVIGNDASLIDSISPLISLTITVAAKLMNMKGKERSILLLDEGPTLFIPNFDIIPATGRENQIATIYCGQDFAQMEERYGEKKAEVLMGNLSNQFYGKISNPKTAEKIVRIFGKEEIEFESRSSSSTNTNRSTGRSQSLQQRDRVTVTHLLDLNPGEFVATSVKLKTFKTRFKNSDSDPIVLPSFSIVTNQMVQANYHRIKSDVQTIIAG
jgi:type IV secretory pathway TraG/TraD family ATPase VirD4